ncbi:AbrB/MazE/SpoVT family DNA-binding domain-containing protein [Metallosphaera hakonensis]|uniref:AbrB/MazE/SpoVT family DNA-binding domain-containing protein n=1 Tax=Metallosphaera hakonensis JCM 8857 = DSM 7519 TaxID=1293036 RepID=A0A2U9IUS3_9CREN|nr:AbrB/MazE/SpoVT family DNA-binding domain-containing protein [Metallosphaera hakonensis]AWR99841.1 AbrB/MazE/SpoVT family DNA-binding domain-containing protein [Metallosphaera hakonensis JCM 8857 = DSM 7519]
MTVRIEVGKKGYIVIPKSVRDLVGIKEGDTLALRVENGRIVLEPEREVDINDVIRKLKEHANRISYAKKAKLGDLVETSLEEEFQ